MAHTPGGMPIVDIDNPRTVPSLPATRLKRASIAARSGAVNHETMSSPDRKPRMVTEKGAPTGPDSGSMVASMAGGRLGGAEAGRTSGVGSGPPYTQV